MQVRAILFDTRSIQRYIFSNNRLKTNIGASYIVSHVFEEVLLGEILKQGKFGLQTVDVTSWKSPEGGTTEQLVGRFVAQVAKADCYVAYIGGGNALLLFPDKGEDHRKEIVSAFTERLLVKYPGLKTGAALGMLELDPAGEYKNSMKDLYAELKNNQFTLFPQVNIMNTGLTLTCEVNGEVANAFVTTGSLVKNQGPRFFSKEVVAKAEAADKADEALRSDFKELLKDYVFPKELENLGQRETENDIAVVHIDGNNMGTRFNSCESLPERGKLSKQVEEKTKTAFKELLKYIVGKYDSYSEFLDLKGNVLPVRPLILGGDDITFVCNAKLALLYTKKFMEFLKDEAVGGLAIDSCAGIAIVSTSYPFFRAYELAEQLCDEAKKVSRKTPGSSWLDYAILHGEQAPTVGQIREQEYRGALGDLHFGPYRVDGENSYHYHIDKLMQAADGIDKELPRSKYKEMRGVLQHGLHDITRFVEQLKHNKQKQYRLA